MQSDLREWQEKALKAVLRRTLQKGKATMILFLFGSIPLSTISILPLKCENQQQHDKSHELQNKTKHFVKRNRIGGRGVQNIDCSKQQNIGINKKSNHEPNIPPQHSCTLSSNKPMTRHSRKTTTFFSIFPRIYFEKIHITSIKILLLHFKHLAHFLPYCDRLKDKILVFW